MLRESLHDEAVKVYDYLMQLRLAHQVRAIDRGREPGQRHRSRASSPTSRRPCSSRPSPRSPNIQKKISFDFLGSA
ncbi:MAG: hypothetical protein MZW92_62215 [Comamonadaceae bacterium]|nr:hypothetical protein [Comamonadaceae bacterium]